MADLVYPFFKRALLGGTGGPIDFDADTLKCMLVNSTYVGTALATLKTHDFINDVSANEISGTGYTAGGQTLTSPTITASGDNYVFDAADPSWATSTITARGAVLYKDTGNVATSPVICLLDFGSDKTSSGGTFQVVFNASGVLQVA